MLQKLDVESFVEHADTSHLLRPSFYWEVIKRRLLYFAIPFLVLIAPGVSLSLLWPAVYLAQGKILVQTQQIPRDLVRPTVTSMADERIQVIQQRVLTRDNLVDIVGKFGLFPGRRSYLSVTEQTELMRKNILIEPLTLGAVRPGNSTDSSTIAFTVGFLYEDPLVATRVANELMTRILNEDLRDRTNRASDTTKFLMREVQRLRDENNAIDSKIAEFKRTHIPTTVQDNPSLSPLMQLRAEYLQKSQIYSDKHPALLALKRQIEAMEKGVTPSVSTSSSTGAGTSSEAAPFGLDALEAQQEATQKDLEVTTQKLAAARLGETLERDQQSEKFEVIEQPTEPQKAYKPDRLKLLAAALAVSVMGGLGIALIAEFADKSFRRTSDLLSIADGSLLISIPYIPTQIEIHKRKRNVIVSLVLGVLSLASVAAIVMFFMPPWTMMLAKLSVLLSR